MVKDGEFDRRGLQIKKDLSWARFPYRFSLFMKPEKVLTFVRPDF